MHIVGTQTFLGSTSKVCADPINGVGCSTFTLEGQILDSWHIFKICIRIVFHIFIVCFFSIRILFFGNFVFI